MPDPVTAFADILANASRAVFFGGAGVSTESGIPDFRSADGVYAKRFRRHLSPEELVSHSFLAADPAEFFAFYKERLVYPDAKPNRTHEALAKLEAAGHVAAVVTQNIDGLHQAAGSKVVHELHGSIHRNYCVDCGRKYPLSFVLAADGVPRCPDCGGMVRPDVVLYEESLDDAVLSDSIRAIGQADALIVAGTSLAVYPAAGLIRYYRGHHLVILNRTPTPADADADLVIHGNMGDAFAEAMKILGL